MSDNNNNQFKKSVKLGQYFNSAGVRVFTRALFRKRSLFVPHLAVQSVAQVDYLKLQKLAGIKYIVFDKDNTLTVPYERHAHPSV